MKKALFSVCLGAFLFAACSSDDDGASNVEGLNLSASEERVDLGGEMNFSVNASNDANIDLTQDADIYVSDEMLDANIFSATAKGSYEAYAEFNGMTSNTVSFDVVENINFEAPYSILLLAGAISDTQAGWLMVQTDIDPGQQGENIEAALTEAENNSTFVFTTEINESGELGLPGEGSEELLGFVEIYSEGELVYEDMSEDMDDINQDASLTFDFLDPDTNETSYNASVMLENYTQYATSFEGITLFINAGGGGGGGNPEGILPVDGKNTNNQLLALPKIQKLIEKF
ncbi:MAG: hypothetical protein ACQESK_10735 [Bacteroidota bacterium]